MAQLSLRGAMTALVTPFKEDVTQIDWEAFEKLVNAQLDGKISGLVPCGTTGETPTLSEAEQLEVIKRTAKLAKGKVPIIAGTGSNDTKKSIAASKAALEAGADGVMIVMPYYNKPSQEGMCQHVQAIAAAVPCPIILYNIPGRSGVELSADSTLRLLDACDNVISVKDATGNVAYCQEVIRRAGDRIQMMSGDDPMTLPMMSVGVKGIISVTGNIYPRQVTEVVEAVEAGQWEDARKKHLALYPVHKVLFVEPNPQPTKAVLAARGMMRACVRLPLVTASAAAKELVMKVIQEYEAS
ncbi:MAG TPA: 4-hydroxy-tetrahydrodipicolinate synthase [Polyangiaceae bacterium]|nr:4-hydroxy-tetrahydrodipicolinate synthase [Polyangiaceae bacterium]